MNQCWFRIVVVAAVVCLLQQATASASLVVKLPTLVTTSPTSTSDGYFDVVLGNSSAGQLLGDYQLSLMLSSVGNGLSITGAGTGVNRPIIPVYPNTNPAYSSDPGLGIPNGVYVFTDAASNSPVTETVQDSSGLVRVLYTVQAGTVGTFNLTLLRDTGNAWDTYFDDQNENLLSFDVQAGSITFTPEPASLAVMGLSAIALIRRRR